MRTHGHREGNREGNTEHWGLLGEKGRVSGGEVGRDSLRRNAKCG